jgi:hypothetical protein
VPRRRYEFDRAPDSPYRDRTRDNARRMGPEQWSVTLPDRPLRTGSSRAKPVLPCIRDRQYASPRTSCCDGQQSVAPAPEAVQR